MSNFDKAMVFSLKWKGGYTDNPADPGGETKFGISKRAYLVLDIKRAYRERGREIYRMDYSTSKSSRASSK